MKKAWAVVLTLMLTHSAFAATDEYIYRDPTLHTYMGRSEAAEMIRNLNFIDLPGGEIKEAVTRCGALNIVKGYNKRFQPGAVVSNEEAIAFIMRVLGMETQSQQTGVALRENLLPGEPLPAFWALGYLNQAMQIGLLTQNQYNEAMVRDQSILDPAVHFVRAAPVTREQTADWLTRALTRMGADTAVAVTQSIYRYTDWRTIAVDKAAAVEYMTANHIMEINGSRFRPQAPVTRGEMAGIFANMDVSYYTLIGIQKKTGTVGAILDEQNTQTGLASVTRDILIRTMDGTIDCLRYVFRDSDPHKPELDAVVYRDGQVASLAALQEGDEIEFLARPSDINPAEGTIIYVQVTNAPLEMKTVRGILEAVDMTSGAVTISDGDHKNFSYTMADGLYATEADSEFVRLSDIKWNPEDLPYGSLIELYLKNQIIDRMEYEGEPTLFGESRGIVLENNANAGYMQLMDNDGQTYTKFYHPQSIDLKRTPFYSRAANSHRYELFDFHFDPHRAKIDSIEPGDIVYYETDPANPAKIIFLRVSEDYLIRFGKIRDMKLNNSLTKLRVEFEDGREAQYSVPNSVLPDGIIAGDWVKMLVGQAILRPGVYLESVKAIRLEGNGHYISRIVTGQFTGIDLLQNNLLLQNARTLSKTGWTGDGQIARFDLAGNDTSYYYDGTRISLDYARQYLHRVKAYVALENYYGGERARKVVFRSGRDEHFSADTVLRVDGFGGFNTLGHPGMVFMDDGVIVRRFGRFADWKDLQSADYAAVNLAGETVAAVVDIQPAPQLSGVFIMRGRVTRVRSGEKLQVESIALLNGVDWLYTPVPRVFAIEPDTLLIDETGVRSPNALTDLGENSVIDRVYTVVTYGAAGVRLLDAPFCSKVLRGVVYQAEQNILSLRDVTVFDTNTGQWNSYGKQNQAVQIPVNAVLVKNNDLVGVNAIEVGDQLRILTNAILSPPADEAIIDGYVVLTEK